LNNLILTLQQFYQNDPDSFWLVFHLVCSGAMAIFFLVLIIVNWKAFKDVDSVREEKKDLPPSKDKPSIAEEVPDKLSLHEKIRLGLTKTRESLSNKLESFLSQYKQIDDELLEDVLAALISADIGVSTSEKLIEEAKQRLERSNLKDPALIKSALKEVVKEIVNKPLPSLDYKSRKPWIVMVIGVNGVGKTTTIGKLANRYVQEGNKVLLAAADTFRAAAIDQLGVWSERVGIEMVRHQPGSDPSAVVFDAIKSAKSKDTDVLIIDTAGRLHTKNNLMEELGKVKRIINRESDGGPHEILLILDATTGQNAVQQAKTFKEIIDVTGIVLTKLDGTAKGGVCIGICNEFSIPIRYIGIGEKITDLKDFDGASFTEALF